MNNITEFRASIHSGAWDAALAALYSCADTAKARILALCDRFEADFGGGPGHELMLFSAPGRTEICGNHTDHNHGRVLAGAVNLDALALARATDSPIIRLHSLGFDPNDIDITSLEPQQERDSDALLRGVCHGFAGLGRPVGGFDAVTQSDVLAGSGLSSSAAFENLIGVILDHVCGSGDLPPQELAKISRFAENVHMKKPSGLMDQMASAVGGLVTIDFADESHAAVEPIDYDFTRSGHVLAITGPIGSHADLTDAYASIPREMRQVAAHFGKAVLRELDTELFRAELGRLYGQLPDRALLRAWHFFEENERVADAVEALKTGEFGRFLHSIAESGRSSFMYLQNVHAPEGQGLGLALAVSEAVLSGQGACRVHGGGFAGTIQAFVPHALADEYTRAMEALFGAGCCMRLVIRPQGAIRILC